jgi:hypothetical protein
MKPMKHFGVLKLLLAVLIMSSCSKPHETPPDPNPPVEHEFTVDNKWECEVDGIKYSGIAAVVGVPATRRLSR